MINIQFIWFNRIYTPFCFAGACVFCDSEANSDVPYLRQPEYDSDGNPTWTPRIVGGSPVALGEFKGIVSEPMVSGRLIFADEKGFYRLIC